MSKATKKGDSSVPQEPRLSFEENLQKLDVIVSELERGSLPLDKALQLYEEGINAYRACQEMLKQADLKVAKLVETVSGELKEEPFAASEEGEEE